MTRDDLLVPCTRALLEGWTGPVAGHLWSGIPVMTVSIGVFTDEGDAMLWTEAGDAVGGRGLCLDLSLPECRDRVARVLGAKFGSGRTSTAPEWSADEGGWALAGTQVPFPDEWWLAVWDRQGWGAGAAKDRVPALADIDPNDDTRLPDGSRLVDALALAAVWRAVSA